MKRSLFAAVLLASASFSWASPRGARAPRLGPVPGQALPGLALPGVSLPAAVNGLGPAAGLPGALGVPATEVADSPTPLVLVQIDGLGSAYLEQAITEGYAPNLKRLIDGGFRALSIKTGVPTVTMSAQTALFYGKFVPGNEWHSKALGGETVANDFERKIDPSEGLLHGGRAYLSERSGGAARTADVKRVLLDDEARVGWTAAHLKELSVGFPLLMRYFWAHGLLRAPLRLAGRVLSDVVRLRRDFKKKGFTSALDKKAPFFLPLVDHLWSPIAEQGVVESIRDGARVSYADLAAYDEEAHYYGPASKQAFSALRRIDAHVGRIAGEAEKRGARLLVFSDHGQTPTLNFQKLYGRTVQQALDELSGEPGALIFSHVYSMGNIYARDTREVLSLEALERRFPGLVDKLLAHPGFGLVAGRNADGSLALRGRPLSEYADARISEAQLKEQIRDYLAVEETGDLVVFSPLVDGQTIDYNPKYTLASAHGGIGGEQMHPFALFDPAKLALDAASWLDLRGLHRALKSQIAPYREELEPQPAMPSGAWGKIKAGLLILLAVILFLAGVAMIPLPGPGVPAMLIALALLSRYFGWARKLRDWIKRAVTRMLEARQKRKRDSR